MQLRVNPEVYDRHLEAYPTDNQRLESTFLTSYDNTFGGTSTFYPDHNGSDRSQSWNTSFPLPFKTSLKDKTQTFLNDKKFVTTKNWKVENKKKRAAFR